MFGWLFNPFVGIKSSDMGRPRLVALVLVLVFSATLALSLLHGAPRKLPSAAMDWPLLLHLLRASAAAGLVGVGALIVLRLWGGELPTKVSTTGAEWERPLQAPDREVRDQLLRVEKESKAATEELRAVLQVMAARLGVELPEGPLEAVDAAMGRWTDALDDAAKKDSLADAMIALPNHEKLVIALHYYENLSLKEIAEVLGVTEAGASRLHARALGLLRDALGREPFEDRASGWSSANPN